jgi:predicted methyltransferase
MSKFGETSDRILEMLYNGEKLDIEKIEERLSLSNASLIYFMDEFGLIELNEGTARITESGLELLA